MVSRFSFCYDFYSSLKDMHVRSYCKDNAFKQDTFSAVRIQVRAFYFAVIFKLIHLREAGKANYQLLTFLNELRMVTIIQSERTRKFSNSPVDQTLRGGIDVLYEVVSVKGNPSIK